MAFQWDDIRIAYQVAESGSLSAAGKLLGMTHSTVLRHINRLEQDLQVRLFIRHQRGYRLTDAGQLLLARSRDIAAEMQRLENSLNALENSPAGNLRISTVSDFSPFLARLMAEFRQQYPQIRVQSVSTDEVLALDRSDVHVAIRMGSQPQGPDLVARRLSKVRLRFYASQDYQRRFGLPQSLADVSQHQWLLPSGHKRSIANIALLAQHIDDGQVIFESNSFTDIYYAVKEGMGIGPFDWLQSVDETPLPLVEAEFGLPVHESDMWLVYHKDMKNSARVKALQQFLVHQVPLMQQRLSRSWG